MNKVFEFKALSKKDSDFFLFKQEKPLQEKLIKHILGFCFQIPI